MFLNHTILPEGTDDMGLFNWSAPLFRRFGDRWDDETIERYRDWLAPCMSPNGRLLDLGGGTGALARRLADALGTLVTVVDPTPEMVASMKPHPYVKAILGSAECIPFDRHTFDGVIVSDAFHHFRDQDGAAREIARVVKPGGCVLVLEFDRMGWMRFVVWGEQLLGEPGHFFAPDEACAFFARFGIEGECVREPHAPHKYYFLGRTASDGDAAVRSNGKRRTGKKPKQSDYACQR
jgi:demethylmenaquinone methyltransferase/2-methoxy-6-polyprenyl-1,4-benzoquinol methylase